jgi:hypothetical protein
LDTALASLLGPFGEEQFHNNYYEKAPLLVSRQDPDFYRTIVNAADMDYLVTAACRLPGAVELLSGGASGVPPAQARETDPQRVLAAFRKGATARVRNVENLWKPVWDLCHDLSADFEFPVSANLYCTPPYSQGLQRHFDFLDVFILHAAGQKCWTVYSCDREIPNQYTPAAGFPSEPHDWDWPRLAVGPPPQTLLQCELHPGDLLYLPRGFGHEAAAGPAFAMHLTLALHTFTWTHVSEVALAAFARTRTGLRKSISMAPESEIRRLLHEFAETADLAEARGLLAKAYARTRRELPAGRLTDFDTADGIAADSKLQLRAGLAPAIFASGGRIAFAIGDSISHFQPGAEGALRHVMQQRQFRPADLPGLSESESIVFSRELHRTGAVRRLP